MRVATAILFSVLAITSVHGQTDEENSANFLFLGCKAFAEGQVSMNNVSAANYCSGILNALGSVSALLPTELRSCIPPDVTSRQEAFVVIRYLENHAALMNKDFRTLTLYAYQQAWPCSAQ